MEREFNLNQNLNEQKINMLTLVFAESVMIKQKLYHYSITQEKL